MQLFSSCLRVFRVTVSVVVGSGRRFAALLLGAVCIGVDGQFPVLMGTLYTGSAGCAPNSFVMVDAMYLAFRTLDALVLSFHLPSMAQTIRLCLFLRRSYVPSRPRLAGSGRCQGRTPSQSPSWQTGSRNNPVDQCLETHPRLHRPLDALPLTDGL